MNHNVLDIVTKKLFSDKRAKTQILIWNCLLEQETVSAHDLKAYLAEHGVRNKEETHSNFESKRTNSFQRIRKKLLTKEIADLAPKQVVCHVYAFESNKKFVLLTDREKILEVLKKQVEDKKSSDKLNTFRIKAIEALEDHFKSQGSIQVISPEAKNAVENIKEKYQEYLSTIFYKERSLKADDGKIFSSAQAIRQQKDLIVRGKVGSGKSTELIKVGLEASERGMIPLYVDFNNMRDEDNTTDMPAFQRGVVSRIQASKDLNVELDIAEELFTVTPFVFLFDNFHNRREWLTNIIRYMRYRYKKRGREKRDLLAISFLDNAVVSNGPLLSPFVVDSLGFSVHSECIDVHEVSLLPLNAEDVKEIFHDLQVDIRSDLVPEEEIIDYAKNPYILHRIAEHISTFDDKPEDYELRYSAVSHWETARKHHREYQSAHKSMSMPANFTSFDGISTFEKAHSLFH